MTISFFSSQRSQQPDVYMKVQQYKPSGYWSELYLPDTRFETQTTEQLSSPKLFVALLRSSMRKAVWHLEQGKSTGQGIGYT
jgi:hypothetical protein